MKWLHLVIGIVLFFIFTETGRRMRIDFPDKDLIPQDLRILTRSRHIYILFNSLIFIVLGVYFRWAPRIAQRAFQVVGSLLLLTASGYLLWGWYVETYELAHFSNISRWGIYLSLAGVVAHILGGITPGVSSKE
jgi:hypothetical protein